MSNNAPVRRFDVVAPRENSDGKTRWIRLGSAAEWPNGSISIELDAVPTGNWWNGRFNLYEPREDNRGVRRRGMSD